MNLAETLREYIQACFTGLWIESHEHEDALAEIRAVCAVATADGTAISMLQKFHRFTQSAEIVQALVRQINAGKHRRRNHGPPVHPLAAWYSGRFRHDAQLVGG